MDTTLPRGAILRLYFSLQTFNLCVIAFLEPLSMISKLKSSDAPLGWIVVTTMTIISALGVVDTLVNDYAPDKYVFEWCLDCRHHLYMSLAICYGFLMWLTMSAEAYAWMPYYALNLVFIAIAAFMDVKTRCRAIFAEKVRNAHSSLRQSL